MLSIRSDRNCSGSERFNVGFFDMRSEPFMRFGAVETAFSGQSVLTVGGAQALLFVLRFAGGVMQMLKGWMMPKPVIFIPGEAQALRGVPQLGEFIQIMSLERWRDRKNRLSIVQSDFRGQAGAVSCE